MVIEHLHRQAMDGFEVTEILRDVDYPIPNTALQVAVFEESRKNFLKLEAMDILQHL